MKEVLTATIWQEVDLYLAQCREIEIASQGEAEAEALTNFQEAIELHFDQPVSTEPEVSFKVVEVQRRAMDSCES